MTAPPPPASAPEPELYSAFGLRIRSSLGLPGLRVPDSPVGEGATEVVVRQGRVEAPNSVPDVRISAWQDEGGDGLSWRGRARIRVTTEEIVYDSDDEPFVRQCVVGPGFGVLLHRRDVLALHGSAVEIGGRAVVLLGPKGAGKSTTAAAILARGHRLLTDDLVALTEVGGVPHVLPGPTQMKLWPASAAAVGAEGVVPFLNGLSKGVWHGAAPAPNPVPLGLVCFLEWGGYAELEPVTGAAAFSGLLSNVYAPRFLGPTASAAAVAPCVRLAERVSTCRLVRPQVLGELGAVSWLVESAVVREAGHSVRTDLALRGPPR